MNPKISLISYGSRKFADAAKRFKREAQSIPYLEKGSVYVYGPEDLSPDFILKNSKLYDPDPTSGIPREGGWWTYKSYFLKKHLLESDADIVIYLDAGSTLHPDGQDRFWQYANLLMDSPYPALGFQMTNNLEYQWTSQEVFKHFNISDDDPLKSSGQLAAGVQMWKKEPASVEAMDAFIDAISTDPNLVTNAYNSTPQIKEFKKCRHDQSLFSVIRKKIGVEILSDETWPVGKAIKYKIPFIVTRSKSLERYERVKRILNID